MPTPSRDEGLAPLAELLLGVPTHSALVAAHGAFARAESPAKADALLAPYTLRAYRQSGAWGQLTRLADTARREDKRLLLFVGHGDDDFRVRLPGCVLVHDCFERSTARQLLTLPALIDDPIPADDEWEPVDPGRTPTIGFCGHSDSTRTSAFRRPAKNVVRRVGLLRRGCVPLPQNCWDHVRLRARLLERLARDIGVQCDFIRRDRFRAGTALGTNEAANVRVEFYENIRRNLYTLCVRGQGNYSYRLFETLAWGRIPLYVDTGSPLPFEGLVEWDALVVRVPVKDASGISNALKNFHHRHSFEELIERQRLCRRAWLEYLSKAVVFRHLAGEIAVAAPRMARP